MANYASLVYLVAVVAGIALVGIGGDSYRRWDRPGSTVFSLYLVSCGLIPVVSLSFAVVSSTVVPTLLFLGFWCVATVVWFLFALQYTGTYTRQGPLLVGLLLVPSLVLVPWLLEPGVGSLGATAAALSAVVLSTYSALALIGTLLVFRSTVLDDYVPLSQGSALIVAGIVPSLAVTLFGQLIDQDVTVPSASIFAGGFVITAVAAALVVYRYDAFDPVPTAGLIGERAMLRETDDLVAIVDVDDRILSLNERTRDVVEESVSLGTGLSDALGYTRTAFDERDTVDLDTARGVRQFDSQVSRLTDGHGRELGAIVSLRDVTERELRKQRLEVFNRILGHNIRNEVSVITANAEVVADEVEETLTARLDTAIDSADSLQSLGTKARRIEEILAAESQRQFALGEFLGTVADEYENRWPGASVTVDGRSSAGEIRCDRPALRFVLDNLVENAVEHADSDTPQVELAATVDGNERYPVVVEVRDDGPGIPDRERAVLDEGEETPLEHGSGVGLWVTNWATTDLGGDLSLAQRESGGTVARVRLPSSVLPDATSE
ncbi:Signal transduction histidine kinase [Halovenus aranensis]|uniref:histidine kinase n=1 Tax=Halovenus aranensis TaxID=890420 RepID=A0A1G8YPI1_9EURY|nr:sensor histidine kinase [Halovenus aranensis]SDK03950.1 Signal transduction histidine kinase [Halovenus aranensis]